MRLHRYMHDPRGLGLGGGLVLYNMLSDLFQRLINVDTSSSVMIMVITSREPREYDCKT